jgi:exopolysaccharide biosynthesis predicted pyruvyltransferase EpsI
MKQTGKEIIRTLSARIDQVLSPLVPAGVPCALVEFPNYANAGDSAIWLGEKAWLRKNGNPVVYSCTMDSYHPGQLADRLGTGVILLQGGGNFGDLWVSHQYFRERIVKDFPQNKIIQLPQSIHFQDPDRTERTRKVLGEHPDFTLLVRDQPSYDLATTELQVPVFLCPDMAFALGTLPRPGRPQEQILWLSRTDKETLNQAAPLSSEGFVRTDWLEEPSSDSREELERLSRELKTEPSRFGDLFPPLSAAYDRVAEERLLRGSTLLSQGSVVVTDRLHGHIMCLLLDIPHVLMDNSYGKVSGFYDAWTHSCELVQWAPSSEAVVETALTDLSFRRVLSEKGVELEALHQVVGSLRISMSGEGAWATAAENARQQWERQVSQTKADLRAFTAATDQVLLIDEDQLRLELQAGTQRVLPFPGYAQAYAGPPASDQSAIQELERHRQDDVRFIAVAWPAFWWLDHYAGFSRYLHEKYQCVLKNERLVLFDLKTVA